MAKKQSQKFDAAGWKFWTVTFFVLLGPAIYGMAQIVRANTKGFVIVFMAALGAAAAAAIVSWLVNSLLHLIQRSDRKQQKKSHR